MRALVHLVMETEVGSAINFTPEITRSVFFNFSLDSYNFWILSDKSETSNSIFGMLAISTGGSIFGIWSSISGSEGTFMN